MPDGVIVLIYSVTFINSYSCVVLAIFLLHIILESLQNARRCDRLDLLCDLATWRHRSNSLSLHLQGLSTGTVRVTILYLSWYWNFK